MITTTQVDACTRARLLAACRPPHTVVALHGEIDVATAPALRRRLLNTLQHSTDLLVLDLSAVSFCDASGLSVLVDVRRRAMASGITVRIAAPRPPVARLLHVTGLDRAFPVHPTLSSALVSRGSDRSAGRNPDGTPDRSADAAPGRRRRGVRRPW
ncbi:STAS domain-containing protein [Planomonospora sp. ID82291]|uniref:STAS domain-containing protein n=1 Tax=Planomonospora sp. ID82291 TaxID=2738136 RepID=UPI0018C3DDD6|nr:STAS domain-containing protein [Planomonospora sp. ID82291]MBG0814560.1 STAS domain-containing protein [Planomonospora sp. ID82291]